MKSLVIRIVEIAAVLALFWIVLSVEGCSTVSGFGQDLQRLSEPYNQK